MQYIAWPDHGVPDDSSDFLDFILRVRQNRVGMVEPTVVHCRYEQTKSGCLLYYNFPFPFLKTTRVISVHVFKPHGGFSTPILMMYSLLHVTI